MKKFNVLLRDDYKGILEDITTGNKNLSNPIFNLETWKNKMNKTERLEWLEEHFTKFSERAINFITFWGRRWLRDTNKVRP